MSEIKREPELNNELMLENSGHESESEIKEDEELERAKDSFSAVFKSHKDGPERVEVVVKRLGKLLENSTFNGEEIEGALRACAELDDERKFVDGVMSAIKPILVFRKDHPDEFEKIAREAAMSQEGMTPLNEIMYYGGRDDYIHIHLANARYVENLRALVLDGLQKLAKIIEGNGKVKTIEATSWIVAKNPKLMEKMGFKIEGEIDDEFRRKYFSGDKRKISKAAISREEFLKRYLK